jgi:hypothetical protein
VTCDVGCEKIEKKTGGGTCLQGVIPHVAWHETLPQNRPKPREETKNKLVLSKIDFCFRLEIYLSK